MKIYTFTCLLDDEHNSHMWCGNCEELHISTEAPTYEALVERAWQIAPEMAVEHGYISDESQIQLSFITNMKAPHVFLGAAE